MTHTDRQEKQKQEANVKVKSWALKFLKFDEFLSILEYIHILKDEIVRLNFVPLFVMKENGINKNEVFVKPYLDKKKERYKLFNQNTKVDLNMKEVKKKKAQ